MKAKILFKDKEVKQKIKEQLEKSKILCDDFTPKGLWLEEVKSVYAYGYNDDNIFKMAILRIEIENIVFSIDMEDITDFMVD